MKYYLAGLTNILLGLLILSIVFLFEYLIVPKLLGVYQGLSATLPAPNSSVFLFYTMLGVSNLMLGVATIRKSPNRHHYFCLGLTALIVSFFLSGFFVSYLTDRVLNPLYDLTSSL